MEAGAEMIDDRAQRPEDLVADVALAQVIREVFDRIKFRAVGREWGQVECSGKPQGSCGTPTGAIQPHQAMIVGNRSSAKSLLSGQATPSSWLILESPISPVERLHRCLYRFQSVTDMLLHSLIGFLGVSFRNNANQIGMKIGGQYPLTPRRVVKPIKNKNMALVNFRF
jgi:hypothetical protein